MTEAQSDLEASDRNGGGFSGRLHVSRQLATRLAEPVDSLSGLSSQYSTELLNIDSGVISLIRQIKNPAIAPEDASIGEAFLTVIREVADASRISFSSVFEFAKYVDDLAQMSQQLRPLMRSLRKSLQQVLDGATVISEWERLIDEGRDEGSGDQS